jgi:hypothetical protein
MRWRRCHPCNPVGFDQPASDTVLTLGTQAENIRDAMTKGRHIYGERVGSALGRPKVSAEVESKIREQLALGLGIRKVARLIPCGTGMVQRVKAMTLVHAAGSGHGTATGGVV